MGFSRRGSGEGFGEEDDDVGVLQQGVEAGRREFGGDVGGEIAGGGLRTPEGENRGGKGREGGGIGGGGVANDVGSMSTLNVTSSQADRTSVA